MIKSRLRKIIIESLSKVLEFDPYERFGGVTSKEHFISLIKTDPAFAPFFLHNPKYATARVGGNLITSLHRKLGDMYEEMFKVLLEDKLDVPTKDLEFSIELNVDGKLQERSTDGLIRFSHLSADSKKGLYALFGIEEQIGVAFEVRSCYQIGDSKRIQADRDMALTLQNSNIKPVMLIFCATSLTSPVKRLSKYWNVFQGKETFRVVNELTGFDLHEYLIEESETIEPLMKRIFAMM
jgi:hypothetical protein